MLRSSVGFCDNISCIQDVLHIFKPLGVGSSNVGLVLSSTDIACLSSKFATISFTSLSASRVVFIGLMYTVSLINLFCCRHEEKGAQRQIFCVIRRQISSCFHCLLQYPGRAKHKYMCMYNVFYMIVCNACIRPRHAICTLCNVPSFGRWASLVLAFPRHWQYDCMYWCTLHVLVGQHIDLPKDEHSRLHKSCNQLLSYEELVIVLHRSMNTVTD